MSIWWWSFQLRCQKLISSFDLNSDIQYGVAADLFLSGSGQGIFTPLSLLDQSLLADFNITESLRRYFCEIIGIKIKSYNWFILAFRNWMITKLKCLYMMLKNGWNQILFHLIGSRKQMQDLTFTVRFIFNIQYTLCCKCLGSFAFLWCKMPMFRRLGMREGGKSLPLAFQYLIFMV